LYNEYEKKKDKLQSLQGDAVKNSKQAYLNSLVCPVHGSTPDEKICPVCRRFVADKEDRNLKSNPKQLTVLWENAQKVVDKKKAYREDAFKELLKEGYGKGLVAGRTHHSARIALEDFYAQQDSRWDMVAGRDKDRLIEEAVTEYTKKRQRG